MIQIKSDRELDRMREAGRHVGEILLILREQARPGTTTSELDEIAHQEIHDRELGSSFLDYAPGGAPPFPGVICASINEEIVHGIPGPRELSEGDLLKIDFGVTFEGIHGDSAVAIQVGDPDPEVRRLQDVTRDSLYAGVKEMLPGNRLGDVSSAVQDVIESNGFAVVRDFVGHGIGRLLHEAPQVPNFGRAGRGPRLRTGMVIAIEPMVNCGSAGVMMKEDGWTAVTADSALSCHYEHTGAITDRGPEVLTRVSGSH